MTRKTGNYDEYHLEWLKDPENAAAFLNAVIEDNDREAFLLALRDVAQAQGGMTAIAEKPMSAGRVFTRHYRSVEILNSAAFQNCCMAWGCV